MWKPISPTAEGFPGGHSARLCRIGKSRLPERIHRALIVQHPGDPLIGHISRDSTAINARENPVKKKVAAEEKKPGKRGRPKKGEERLKEPTRLERQAAVLPLSEMIAELPTDCDVVTRKNSKGYKTSWIGYKLHIDAADSGIPVSCLLTASVHDSQVAMPLAEITNKRVVSLYDLMDSAYDSPQIKKHSCKLGRQALQRMRNGRAGQWKNQK